MYEFVLDLISCLTFCNLKKWNRENVFCCSQQKAFNPDLICFKCPYICFKTENWFENKCFKLASLFEKNLPIRKIFLCEPMKKDLKLFDSTLSQIPIFWTIISIFDSIFDLRSSNSTSIHQFQDSALTRLRLQSFSIRLDIESRVGTPLRPYLL